MSNKPETIAVAIAKCEGVDFYKLFEEDRKRYLRQASRVVLVLEGKAVIRELAKPVNLDGPL